MSIPDLTADGTLPVGVHFATWDELTAQFCRFQKSDRRIQLCDRLRQYVGEAKAAGVLAVIVNGSFVTGSAEPNDVDLIAVLPTEHNYDAELTPAEYNALSRKRVRVQYRFDLLGAAADGSEALMNWIDFFAQVKGVPQRQKGMLRVQL